MDRGFPLGRFFLRVEGELGEGGHPIFVSVSSLILQHFELESTLALEVALTMQNGDSS